MPRYHVQYPPEGWQIVRRPEGHFLQRRRPDGLWEDVAGPYKQRGAANERLRRILHREIMDHRKAGDEITYEWQECLDQCKKKGGEVR